MGLSIDGSGNFVAGLIGPEGPQPQDYETLIRFGVPEKMLAVDSPGGTILGRDPRMTLWAGSQPGIATIKTLDDAVDSVMSSFWHYFKPGLEKAGIRKQEGAWPRMDQEPNNFMLDHLNQQAGVMLSTGTFGETVFNRDRSYVNSTQNNILRAFLAQMSGGQLISPAEALFEKLAPRQHTWKY